MRKKKLHLMKWSEVISNLHQLGSLVIRNWSLLQSGDGDMGRKEMP